MTNKEFLRAYLLSFLGTPYIYGGSNRLIGLDCSQYACEAGIARGLLKHGTDLTSQGLFDYFGPAANGAPKFGDYTFYGINLKNITHVGISLTKTHMIEAGGGDRTTTTIEEAKRRGAMVRIRPIRYRTDFLGHVSLPEFT